MEAVGRLLRGQRILITGAAGSIGGEMVRQIASFTPDRLILVDQAETPLHDIRLMMARDWRDINAYTLVADIANKSRMEEIFSEHRPAYVFHAAAYKHVPMMEDNPCESVGNNVDGTRVIADLAVKYGTRKFVMISTDKAVNPTNVMGCSKRICEIYVQSLDKAIKEGHVEGVTQFVTTRFGNVLGSNGSVIPLFREQIAKGGPVTVTHPDIIRFFMLIPEACRLVLEAGTMGERWGDLRLRHGQTRAYHRLGETYDSAFGRQERRGPVYGSSCRREAVRGGTERRGDHAAYLPSEDQDRQGTGVRL